ncbi:hypothetical protein [Loktanella salsilacus]|uniref:hypothetical protein n=1 Tax=Loktanella salsilacus TaxID=195913 RepID=UPI003736C7AC
MFDKNLDSYADRFSPQDLESARRSLLISAILTISIPNIDFIDSKLNLLATQILIEKERLVATGQILTCFFLIAFLLKLLPDLAHWLQVKRAKTLQLQHYEENKQLAESWGHDNVKEYEDSPNGEFEALNDKNNKALTELETRYENIIGSSTSIANLILKIAFPISISTLAIFFPNGFSHFITMIEKQ